MPNITKQNNKYKDLMKIPSFIVKIFFKFGLTEIQSIGNIYGTVLAVFVTIMRSFSSSIIHGLPKIPSIEILFIESIFAFLILILFTLKDLKKIVKTRAPRLQLLKAIANLIGTFLMFESLKNLNLAVSSVLSLSSIFFGVVGSFFVFSEKPKIGIIFSIFLTCFGVFFISDLNVGHLSYKFLYPISAAFFFSLSTMFSKEIALFDSLKTSLFFTFLFQIIFTFYPAYKIWESVNFNDAVFIFATAAIILLSLALSLQSDTFSALAFSAPFKCIRVVFAAMFGYMFFDENISLLSFIGIVLIIFSYLLLCKNNKEITSYYIQKRGKKALE